MIKHVISVSGGKDSAATLLLALERFNKDSIIPIFCDTGNEHEAVYEYLDYLEDRLGIKINRLTSNFDAEIANKRMFIARDRRTRRVYKRGPKTDRDGNSIYIKNDDGTVRLYPVYESVESAVEGNPTISTDIISHYEPRQVVGSNGGTKVRWTNKAKRRALAVLQPTGNPYLDLCMWKGRFPSRKAQFCTEHLKRNPAVEFQMDLVDRGFTVVSWQGVRRDESLNRRNAKKFERIGPSMFAYRPIVDWTAADVFTYCGNQGVKANPLYLQGMGRVGCMPCINAAKGELREISSRFPEHIDRIADWEVMVGAASKRSAATFIPAPSRGKAVIDQSAYAKTNDIYSVIQWSKTTRGGKQFDLLGALNEVTSCSSSYGLCE